MPDTPDTAPIADRDHELRGDVAATIAKLHTVRAQRDQLVTEERQLLDDVRAAVREGNLAGGDYTHGGRKVLSLTYPASFDETKAAEVLPESLRDLVTKRIPDTAALDRALADGVITREQYDAVTVARVDRTLAKENLPPKLYRACCVAAVNPTIKPVA